PGQRVDTGLAQRRSNEAAVIGVPAAGDPGAPSPEPSSRRMAWSTRKQADAAPGGWIGQKLAMKRGAGSEHKWHAQHGDAARPHKRQHVGEHHEAAELLETLARGDKRIARKAHAPAQRSRTGQPDRRRIVGALSPAGHLNV